MEIRQHERHEDGADLPFVVWRFDVVRRVLSSSVLGGGLGDRQWALNATVGRGYDRDDPAEHLRALATGVDLAGPGVAMMTAVDVGDLVHRRDSGVDAWATVGVESASWAAAESPSWHPTTEVGTINVVVDLPVRLADAALVNAALTATEAKVQAMLERGLPGTGTPTDAVCICCRVDGAEEAYAGPRSVWGSRIARAVHAAVAAASPKVGTARDHPDHRRRPIREVGGRRAARGRLATGHGGPVTYVATMWPSPDDDDLAARLEAHRDRRPNSWTTVEPPYDLAEVLVGVQGVVLLDSLGSWLSAQPDMDVDAGTVTSALLARPDHTIVVTDEVGWGVHPPTEAGRQFRDASGRLNQAVASVAGDVLLVVAGRVLRLEEP